VPRPLPVLRRQVRGPPLLAPQLLPLTTEGGGGDWPPEAAARRRVRLVLGRAAAHPLDVCWVNSATGIGMDGVIAVFWTDLDPGKVTDCPQTHHCGGGGNVYYKKDADHLVRQSLRLMRVLGLRDASSLQVPKISCQTHSSALLASLAPAVLSVAASASFLCIVSSRPSSMQRCSRGRGTTSTTYLTQVRLSRLYCGTVATCSSSTSTCKYRLPPPPPPPPRTLPAPY
jgi:hypothetical protein